MESEYIKDNYEIKILSEEDDVSNFSCGLNDMDDFLINDALIQQENNLNVTYLVICDGEIIGFFSLLADRIDIKDMDEEYDIAYETSSAVKIGRLAIDQKYSSKGIGTAVLDNICYNIKSISEKIGIRFITIDAYCGVREFYYKNEFKHFKIQNLKKLIRTAQRNEKTTIPLYKDIKRI